MEPLKGNYMIEVSTNTEMWRREHYCWLYRKHPNAVIDAPANSPVHVTTMI